MEEYWIRIDAPSTILAGTEKEWPRWVKVGRVSHAPDMYLKQNPSSEIVLFQAVKKYSPTTHSVATIVED